ncbi:MAG: type IV secretion system DNA-binding domain-containing protein [Verrucomicrobiae bacterium]|nr:type IV secretion system DNA-binding domain-containing protein [Verrucomicrobiae bacterium]
MPQRFVSERRYINTYLKILFFYHTLRRYELPKAEQAKCNQLLFVADEYQDIVTASNDGVSDHTVIDRIRGARCAIVAGMQSEVSADPAIGRDKRKVLSLNFRTRLIFRAADMEGAIASADFIGKKKVWKQTRSSKAWSTVTRSHREDEDYKFKPAKLMDLRDHHAVIVHPSKRFARMLLRPIDGLGRIPSWFRR